MYFPNQNEIIFSDMKLQFHCNMLRLSLVVVSPFRIFYKFSRTFLFQSLINCLVISFVNGHGRLMDPPARNAMWRFGYPNPVNYNDNELFCGGYAVQWERNGGRCGVCGDAFHLKAPRPHEAGGEFAKGIISRYYTAGQVRKTNMHNK